MLHPFKANWNRCEGEIHAAAITIMYHPSKNEYINGIELGALIKAENINLCEYFPSSGTNGSLNRETCGPYRSLDFDLGLDMISYLLKEFDRNAGIFPQINDGVSKTQFAPLGKVFRLSFKGHYPHGLLLHKIEETHPAEDFVKDLEANEFVDISIDYLEELNDYLNMSNL